MKLTPTNGMILIVALLQANPVVAQVNEDFSSGLARWFQLDATVSPDGKVSPWGPGNFDTSSGALTMSTSGPVPASNSAGSWNPREAGFLSAVYLESLGDPFLYTDGVFNTQVTFDTDATAGSIIVRGDPATFSGYVFFAGVGTGHVGIERYQGVLTRSETVDLGVSVGETWNLESTVFGSSLSLKAWRDGDTKPDSPTISIVDDRLTAGAFGLGAGMENGATWGDGITMSVTHDDFSYVPVPEPSGAMLLLLGMLGTLRIRSLAKLNCSGYCALFGWQ